MTDMVPSGGASLTFGQTHLTGANVVPPRVKIIQAMSAEKNELGSEGEFFNTLTSESYGDTLRFLPLLPFMNRVLLVRDERRAKIEALLDVALSEGDGLKCRSLDMNRGTGEPGILCGECPLSHWEGNEPPLCSEVYNLAALTEIGELIILGFSKSSAKTGRKLFSMLRFAGPGVAPWSRFYEAKTSEVKLKGKGTFFVPVVKKLPEVPPTELMAQAAEWARELGAIGPIDVTPTEDDEPGGEPTDDQPF